MKNGFVKDNRLLEETSKVEDLLDFSVQSQRLVKKIDTLEGSFVLALVGPFGVGKSTLLNRIINEREKSETWVEFDAWKYPDRKDLWEGFVLDVAREISPEAFKKAEKKIKGTNQDDKKTLISTLSKIPGFAALEGFNHFLRTSPARRVDEVQEILKEQIKLLGEHLYIVVEDIDRSGDSGVFFLETLKRFLRDSDFKKKVCVIVPIANENYHKNLDSYLKCIDYFEFFEIHNLNLTTLVERTFDISLFDEPIKKSQTISFLEGLFKEFPSMTMRLLKLILRKADLVYRNQVEDGHEPDFRVTLCIESSKYFNVSDKPDVKFFDEFKKRNAVIRGNIFDAFLTGILAKEPSIYRDRHNNDGSIEKKLLEAKTDFRFIERRSDGNFPSVPWTFINYDNGGNPAFGITKFYTRY